MALDVMIKGLLRTGVNSGFSFDDDGYYWFMHPWFEKLSKQTGKYIDLYGGVEFSPIEFPRLRTITNEVRQQVLARPLTWQVTIGWQTHPERKEIRREVKRTDFLKLLDDFEALMDQASLSGKNIACIGD